MQGASIAAKYWQRTHATRCRCPLRELPGETDNPYSIHLKKEFAMYELTESQALEVGGGMDGVPHHYKSQRVILPPWPHDPPEPREYPPPPMPMPSFGA